MAATRVLDESNDHDVATAEPQIEDSTEKREAAAVPSTDRVNQILGPKPDPKGGSIRKRTQIPC